MCKERTLLNRAESLTRNHSLFRGPVKGTLTVTRRGRSTQGSRNVSTEARLRKPSWYQGTVPFKRVVQMVHENILFYFGYLLLLNFIWENTFLKETMQGSLGASSPSGERTVLDGGC